LARYNKIYLGPVQLPLPQVREALGDVALTPGCLVVLSSGKWVLAGATTVGKVWLVQDNYLRLAGVDTAWLDEDSVIGMELLPDRLYAGRIANGVNITAVGTPLTPAASGLLGIASTSDLIIGYSEEIFNNDTGSTALIKFRPAGLSYLSAAP
jgi:hypothetical protein